MVHPDGGPADQSASGPEDRGAARHRAARDRRHALGAGEIEEPDPRDGRGAAGLGDQPPARLGRADRALRQPQDRRLSQGRRGQLRASSAPSTRAAPTPGSRPTTRPCSATATALEDYEPVNGHPRRLVRFGLDPRLRDRGALRRGRPRRPLCRRLGPASRLVPVVACSKAAAPAAGRPSTAVLTHGFALDGTGPQDVEERRQRRRSARRSSATTAPTSSASGSPRPTISRTSGSARRCSPPPPTPIASSATPSATCSARSTASRRRRRSCRPPRCRSWSAGCCTGSPTLDAELREAADGFEFNRYIRG